MSTGDGFDFRLPHSTVINGSCYGLEGVSVCWLLKTRGGIDMNYHSKTVRELATNSFKNTRTSARVPPHGDGWVTWVDVLESASTTIERLPEWMSTRVPPQRRRVGALSECPRGDLPNGEGKMTWVDVHEGASPTAMVDDLSGCPWGCLPRDGKIDLVGTFTT